MNANSVKELEKGQDLKKDLENSLEFFKGGENVIENEEDMVEYQKVSLAALTMCCTCDSNWLLWIKN